MGGSADTHLALRLSKDRTGDRRESALVLHRMYWSSLTVKQKREARKAAHRELNKKHRERLTHVDNAYEKNLRRIRAIYKTARRKVERKHSEELREWRERFPLEE